MVLNMDYSISRTILAQSSPLLVVHVLASSLGLRNGSDLLVWLEDIRDRSSGYNAVRV
jgi:hypothetical protein